MTYIRTIEQARNSPEPEEEDVSEPTTAAGREPVGDYEAEWFHRGWIAGYDSAHADGEPHPGSPCCDEPSADTADLPRNPIIGRESLVPLATPTAQKLAEHFPEEAFHRSFALIEAEARQQGTQEGREAFQIVVEAMRDPSGRCYVCGAVASQIHLAHCPVVQAVGILHPEYLAEGPLDAHETMMVQVVAANRIDCFAPDPGATTSVVGRLRWR